MSSLPSGISKQEKSFNVGKERVEYNVYKGKKCVGGTWGTGGDIFHGEDFLQIRTDDGWEEATIDSTVHPHYEERYLGVTRGKPLWLANGTRRSRASKRQASPPEVTNGKRSRKISSTYQTVAGVPSNPACDSDPTTTVTKAGHTDRNKIKELRDEWASAPLNLLPRAIDGLAILNRLLSYPTSIPLFDNFIPFQRVYDGEAPTYSHIIADLLYAEKLDVVDQGLRCVVEGVRREQILASWLEGPYVRKADDTVRLYSILDLPFQIQGSRRCRIKVPEDLTVDGITEKKDGCDVWGTSMCPAGTLTDIHFDYSGPAQLIVSVRGRKLWLLWPPTPSNLQWWKAHHTRPANGTSTLAAIDTLEHLQLLFMDNKSSFILPPYHFHAVLTFEASAHCGGCLWTYGWWKKTSKMCIEWEYQWAKDYAANGFVTVDAIHVLAKLGDGMKKWKRLIVAQPNHPMCGELKEWQKAMSQKIREFEKSI